jgi:NAD(P)-dependent dehydrogenase (short-subunit alcohol dehydrogenase family)
MSQGLFALDGKVAVVTGASRGIGAAIAGALARAGARVALVGRDENSLQASADAQGIESSCRFVVCADVRSPSEIEAALGRVVDAFGGIDILVNNAGTETVCPSLEVTESLWDLILDTNLKGAFFCAQAAARRMSRGGAIVNVCSLTSEVGVAGASPYGASKSGLAGLTRALATEWAQRGIRVNGIGPGYFRTALTETFYQDPAWQEAMLAKIPMRRFGQPQDLGGVVVFLCSPAADYLTGQILYVDGGYLAAL